MNRAILSGAISSYGVRLSYTQASKPQLSFQLDIEESGYHTFIPCQIVGANSEPLAETLEAGEYILLEGKLSWSKVQQKLLVTAYGVERLHTAAVRDHEPSPEYGSGSDASQFNHAPARRPRKRPYPKQALEGSFQPN